MDGQQRLLGGRYLLKDKVGTGGMATVYRAQDQVLDRTVAVKIMLPQYAGDATFAARFKQEAQAAAGLSSPYIVGVYDWGKDGDTYYIVMEYLRGTDLKSGIRSHGALDPKKVAQIGSQICGALSVAHKHEIIHRDIKPQNIMVLPDGNIKVMDFGIARAKNSHLTQDNNVLGTAHYVSPEQARGQELGPTSDLYSLGVVMYECATGHVPFDGDDAISVAVKQMNELPVPPSQINPAVDPDLERIILRCMEKDPANRFQTADELRAVLNNYLAGRNVELPEPTRVIAGAGTTETRVMSDQTQAMARAGAAVNPAVGAAGRTSASTYSSNEPEHEGLSKGKIAAIVVAVIAVAAIAVFALSSLLSPAGNATVPDVVGKQQEEAVNEIRSAGFTPKVTEEYNDSVDEGLVADQSPDGNTQHQKGSEVQLVISKGKKPADQVTVPDLTGKTADEAQAALTALGLKGEATEEANDSADEGTVFEQDTAAGTKVDVGSTVKYKVSSGPDSVNVPGVLGMSFSEASNTLSEAGFQVKDGGKQYSDEYPAGQVMSQSVTGSAPKGTTVTLVTSQGPEEKKINVSSLVYKGMSQEQAVAALQDNGLEYTVTEQASSNVAAGSVISFKTPDGSTQVTKGTTVTLVISTGSGPSGNNNNGGTDSGNSGTGNNGNSGGNNSGTTTGGNE